jgi:hypothetical protein
VPDSSPFKPRVLTVKAVVMLSAIVLPDFNFFGCVDKKGSWAFIRMS